MPEYQPNRGNLLEFNNFRMVNVIELSRWSQSLRSLTSLTPIKGSKDSTSMFMFNVDVGSMLIRLAHLAIERKLWA